MLTAHVAELWRYPVKGMRGESVEELDVVKDGIAGDRRYAFESSGAPAGKPLLTGRERAAMLLYTARTVDGTVVVETPRGQSFRVQDPSLTSTLQAELPQNPCLTLRQSVSPFTDCRPIALVSLQALASLSAGYGRPVDGRRFRANLVLRFSGGTENRLTVPEDALVGCSIRIGDTAELRITERDPRCRIVTLDPQTAEADPNLMKHLDRHHDGKLGVYATAQVCGRIRVGDSVQVIS